MSDYTSLSETLRDETTFEVDEFNRSKVVRGLNGLALKLQNLCLTRKDTLPNAGEFGLGIQDYLFELNDEQTLTAIEVAVRNGVKQWLPGSPITEIRVEKLEAGSLGNNPEGILLGFDLRNEEYNTLILSLQKGKGSSSNVTTQVFMG